MEQFNENNQLSSIAIRCNQFEHVISAMGYGYSLLNVAPENFIRSCDYCVHWAGGHCRILKAFQAH